MLTISKKRKKKKNVHGSVMARPTWQATIQRRQIYLFIFIFLLLLLLRNCEDEDKVDLQQVNQVP